jgi:hypothetical protein
MTGRAELGPTMGPNHRQRKEIMQVTEYLTIAEYTKLAKVAESTVYKWMREGKTLHEGVHYIHLGRALRFLYPQCLQAPILDTRASSSPGEGERRKKAATQRSADSRRRARRTPRVNLDFDTT